MSHTELLALMENLAMLILPLFARRFDKIGSLCDDGAVGPLIYARGQRGTDRVEAHAMGPFTDTLSWLEAYLSVIGELAEHLRPKLAEVATLLRECTAEPGPPLAPPFRLMHMDFDAQNLMFSNPSVTGEEPKLTSVIDWEYAQTGPLYYLYEYPAFLVDGMTEEEKEIEAERLFVLFDRLEKAGMAQNPIRKAYQEGKLQYP